MKAKVVRIDATSATAKASVIYFIKTDNDVIFNAALVDGGNGANLVVPIGFWPENADFRTTLNHECYILFKLGNRLQPTTFGANRQRYSIKFYKIEVLSPKVI
jgi:hypothetical protein